MNGKQYFNEVAARWDEIRNSFFTAAFRDKAISLVKPRAGKVACDIGAGTGFITEGLVKKGLKVIAVDQSARMIEQMRKKFSGIDAIDYRLVDAERLPIGDESVDYAFANMFLHHAARPASAIKEIVRILKSGGKMLITDLDEHEFTFLKTEHYDRWMGFKRENVESWFIKAGLKDVKVYCAGDNCCARSGCGGEYAQISIFAAFGKK
jgi:ubiquinone/menaquinone biosynthesis C-methylase UbiE